MTTYDYERRRELNTTPEEVYNPQKMLTGVNVKMHSEFVSILGKKEKSKAARKDESNGESFIMRSVLARGLAIAEDCSKDQAPTSLFLPLLRHDQE